MISPSLMLLESAAGRLEPLLDRLVFVGGAVVELLIDRVDLQELRATDDVDAIVEVASIFEYYELENQVREAGYNNVFEGPICRFEADGGVLDLMPDDESILGFSNPWYSHSLETSWKKTLPSGRSIRVISPPAFLATKLAAFTSKSRDNSRDFQASRDFEDIVRVIGGNPQIVKLVGQEPDDVRRYITGHDHRKQLFDASKPSSPCSKTKTPLRPGSEGRFAEFLLGGFGCFRSGDWRVVSSRSSGAGGSIGGDLGDHERQKGHFAGASNALGDHSLLAGGVTALSCRQNLAAIVDESAEKRGVLVVHRLDLVQGQVADLAALLATRSSARFGRILVHARRRQRGLRLNVLAHN